MTRNRMDAALRRGSALVATLVFAMLMSTVVLYMHSSTMNSAAMSSLRENSDTALAAADLAVEMAVTNLSNMELRPLNPSSDPGTPSELIVQKDWVRSDPFSASGSGSDQRRIGGTLTSNGENMDYRVLVRSLRDARENNTMPESWLRNVNLDDEYYSEFAFDDDENGKLRKFVGTYEITASVRPAAPPSRTRAPGTPPVNARLAVTASSKTLVTLRYQHPLNSQENLAVVNSDNIRRLNPTMEMKISGEDHYGLKAVVQNVIKELVIQDIISIKGTNSQLFSVTNKSWGAGEQTLQFQMDATGKTYNPHVPRTTKYSTNIIDRSMISKDENAQQDKYVFGGKRGTYDFALQQGANSAQLSYSYGRSATFADDDVEQFQIVETKELSQTQMAQSQLAFAMGKFENFNRLYLNYTIPLAQRTTALAVNQTSHPAAGDSSTKVQQWKDKWEQAPLTYWSKNKTKAYQQKTTTPLDNRDSPARRHAATRFWIKNKEGKFLVRDYEYGNGASSGERPPEDWDGYYTWATYYGYGTDPTNNSSTNASYHQGYVYAPSGSKTHAIHTRLLSTEELLGFQVTKGNDGLPARLDDRGNIIGGTPQFVLDEDGEMIPYRLTVNGQKTQFDEGAQRVNSTDNYGIKTNNIDDPRYPPRDGIYVVERDPRTHARIIDPVTRKPKVTVYRTMEDFAYELDLAPPGAEEPDMRELVTIHMVTEQTPETHPSSQNMYFDMGVCISVVFPKIIEEELQVNIFEGMDKYWWEGLAEETLTDRQSHNAVTARSPAAVREATTPEDKLAALYDYGFGRYTGGETQNIFTMVGDDGELRLFKKAVLDTVEDSPAIGTLLNKDDEDPNAFYYVSRDDLYRVLAGMLEQGKVTNETLNNAPVLYNVSLNYIRTLPANWGAQFRLVGERFATDTGYREAFVANSHPSALTVSDKYVSSRAFAGEVFGMLPQNVHASYVVRRDGGALSRATNDEILGNGDPGYHDPIVTKLPFLPSERLVDPADTGYSQDKTAFVPIINKNHNMTQYDGRPLEPKILFPGDFEDEIYKTPAWVDTHALELGYGQRESISRGGIGWHRSGPRFPEPLMQDHYEYVIAGKPGFVPYVLEPTAGAIALIRDESSSMSAEEIKRLKFSPVLKDPKDMPTFFIDGKVNGKDTTLDGAGILVVNGNLEISTEFSYHGTLIVMGDLIMRPRKMSLPKRNENGLIVDADGNVLLNDYKGYYYTRNRQRVDSEPEMVEQMASSLVMQGQLFLGGSVQNIAVDGVKGKIDIRGSSGALEDVTGSMFDGKEKRGIFRLLHNEVDNQSEIDELWPPAQ